MIPVSFLPYYKDFFTLFVFLLTVMYWMKYKYADTHIFLYENKNEGMTCFMVCTFVILYWGLRPLGYHLELGDTYNYARTYPLTYEDAIELLRGPQTGEAFFNDTMAICYFLFNATGWFTLIAAVYVAFSYWAGKKLMDENAYGVLLAFLGSFSTWGFGVNGIRNGFAGAVLVLAMAIILRAGSNKIRILVGIIVMWLAYKFHNSMILPILCFGLAYFVRGYRTAVLFWVLSLFVYLVATNYVTTFFIGLGFDDRIEKYLTAPDSGFRPDFLLYSFMPILLGYNVIEKYGKRNRIYQILLNTYIFANAVWVTIMGASFSNRFAYLSWFLYPFVISYPCLKMNVWGDRQAKIGTRIILYNCLFTVFMTFIYYGFLKK